MVLVGIFVKIDKGTDLINVLLGIIVKEKYKSTPLSSLLLKFQFCNVASGNSVSSSRGISHSSGYVQLTDCLF